MLEQFEFHLAALAKSKSSEHWLRHQAGVIGALSLLRAELLPDERVRFGELERRAEAETESRPAFVDEDAY